jgi:hypothetical protein
MYFEVVKNLIKTKNISNSELNKILSDNIGRYTLVYYFEELNSYKVIINGRVYKFSEVQMVLLYNSYKEKDYVIIDSMNFNLIIRRFKIKQIMDKICRTVL